MAGDDVQALISREAFITLRHDIKNQLSNIQLALSGLQFECDCSSEDAALYISSLEEAARKIDMLLNDIK